MWPFYSRKERATRRALRIAFSRYVSPELIEKLARTPEALGPSVERATISYIILQVRDDDLGQVATYLDQAFEAVLDADGTITSMMSSVAAVAFGIPVRASAEEGIAQRDQAVARLRADLGRNVR